MKHETRILSGLNVVLSMNAIDLNIIILSTHLKAEGSFKIVCVCVCDKWRISLRFITRHNNMVLTSIHINFMILYILDLFSWSLI